MKRREILKGLSLLPVTGLVGGLDALAGPMSPVAAPKRDLFKELGVRTFINATGTLTYMTGSLMHDYVLDAIHYGADHFCMLDELQDKVGERIAQLVHSESAVVTSGAFSAMTLGLAGILTGMDQKKVEALPHLAGTGMKSEVICQKAHDIVYNHAFINTGCKIVAIETVEELERAINEKTALMHFLNIADGGKISQEEWVALGKKHGIPTSIDIAADVPPVSNLWKFHDMGFDMVQISGGKAIRGPQSAGLLMGRKSIIQAARLHMPPRGFNIGRGMKINKEEILGMYVALEQYIARDHDKEWKAWEKSIGLIDAAVKSVPGVETKIWIPTGGNITPNLSINWEKTGNAAEGKDLQEKLRMGNPSIEVGGGKKGVNVTAWMLKPGEDKIVARRIKEELQTLLS
ncbi:aminotransferase class V-fold PLP-dependent enzyme [Flavihumibacter sp. UBA7668]|uniref:aminotransferase class V-fold PLP-dependent enzyme n=1 Tax=Flavihumibacter sp. UBA7668 TaxID=1946542 RepID=UPI0025BF2393|nr:aminotransferase class V-fold PLP-dependent enzyme [Flavihumibacter sp. UBA7668]